MKTVFSLLIVLMFLSCEHKKYKYEIRGEVIDKNGQHPAVIYTDTVSFDGDTLFYHNTDGTEVRIYPPFILKQNYI